MTCPEVVRRVLLDNFKSAHSQIDEVSGQVSLGWSILGSLQIWSVMDLSNDLIFGAGNIATRNCTRSVQAVKIQVRLQVSLPGWTKNRCARLITRTEVGTEPISSHSVAKMPHKPREHDRQLEPYRQEIMYEVNQIAVIIKCRRLITQG